MSDPPTEEVRATTTGSQNTFQKCLSVATITEVFTPTAASEPCLYLCHFSFKESRTGILPGIGTLSLNHHNLSTPDCCGAVGPRPLWRKFIEVAPTERAFDSVGIYEELFRKNQDYQTNTGRIHAELRYPALYRQTVPFSS